MRWVSLAMLCPASTNAVNLTAQIQTQFIHHVEITKMNLFDGGTNVLLHLDKIKIYDDENIHEKIRIIQNILQSNNIIIYDLGNDPTFWSNHTSTIITFIGAYALSLFFYFFPNT